MASGASAGFYQENAQGHEAIRAVCVRSWWCPVAAWARCRWWGAPGDALLWQTVLSISGTVWSKGSVESGVCSNSSSQSCSHQTRGLLLLEQRLWASGLRWHPAGLAGFKMNQGDLCWLLVSSSVTIRWDLPLDFPRGIDTMLLIYQGRRSRDINRPSTWVTSYPDPQCLLPGDLGSVYGVWRGVLLWSAWSAVFEAAVVSPWWEGD